MSVLKASTSENFVPCGTSDDTKEAIFSYTGGANNTVSGVTSATFVIAAVGSSQVVTATIFNPNFYPVGATLEIADGTRKIDAVVTAVSSTGFTAQTVTIVSGSAGDTMSTAATVKQITNATFVVAAVGSNQQVTLGSTAQGALFVVGDTVGVTDGTNTLVTTVMAINGAVLTLQTTTISAGAAGNTMATSAVVTDTSGDLIEWALLPPFVTITGLVLITSAANTSMQVSAGYQSQDGTEVTHNADLIAAATTLATANRIRENAAVAPPTTDLVSYLTTRVTNAKMSAATVMTCIVRYFYKGTP